jgi:hypothetical protein
MKVPEIKELKHKIEVQRGILYACEDTFNDIKYLQGNNLTSSVEKELLGDTQWRFITELMWNYLILELSKLYNSSPNDNYRIEAVLNVLNSKFKSLPFRDRLEKKIVADLLDEFKSEGFQNHYRKLNDIRDKYVAHLDRDRADLRIENEDIEYFLKLNDRVIKEIIDPIENGGESCYFGKAVTLKDFVKEIVKYKGVYDKLEMGIMDPEERKKLKPETLEDLLRILGKRNFVTEGIG